MKNLKYPKIIKMSRKPSHGVLTRLLSKIVRLTAKGKCWICGREGSQACHIFSKKAYPKSRYDFTDNVKWGCFGCHKGSRYSMHENPEWFRDWYEKKFGEGSWQKLKTQICLREATSEKFDPYMTKIILEAAIKEIGGE